MRKCYVVMFKSGSVRIYYSGYTYYYFKEGYPVPFVVDSVLSLLTLLSRQCFIEELSKVELKYL